jgi:hypothetical protein
MVVQSSLSITEAGKDSKHRPNEYRMNLGEGSKRDGSPAEQEPPRSEVGFGLGDG